MTEGSLECLEKTMQHERFTALMDYYGKDKAESSPFFLRAVSSDGLMAGCCKKNEVEAVELAKKYWTKGFMYVEVFCWRDNRIDIVYHGVRWGFN